jgi:predicted small metal-binding protein
MEFDVNESLLEMHFYQYLKEYYKTKHGLTVKNIFKPSTIEEAWLGFDCAWVESKLSKEELENKLKDHVKNKNQFNDSSFTGFFLQFKTVQKVTRKSKYLPTSYSTPYYRSKLSTKVNPHTLLSQHSILKNLSRIDKADVAYACGMVFNTNELECVENLEKLRVVPVDNAPDYTNSNDQHFLTFRDINDRSPQYNSNPIIVETIIVDRWLDKNLENSGVENTLRLLRNTNTIVEREVDKEIEYRVKRLEIGRMRLARRRQIEREQRGEKLKEAYFDRIYHHAYDPIDVRLGPKFSKTPMTRKYANLTIIEFV